GETTALQLKEELREAVGRRDSLTTECDLLRSQCEAATQLSREWESTKRRLNQMNLDLSQQVGTLRKEERILSDTIACSTHRIKVLEVDLARANEEIARVSRLVPTVETERARALKETDLNAQVQVAENARLKIQVELTETKRDLLLESEKNAVAQQEIENLRIELLRLAPRGSSTPEAEYEAIVRGLKEQIQAEETRGLQQRDRFKE
ncbi:unnamed protein product, partial [Amoebophrya sp. A25]